MNAATDRIHNIVGESLSEFCKRKLNCLSLHLLFVAIQIPTHCDLRLDQCRMSRLFKTAVLGMYSAISVLFIRSLFVERNVEMVEIEYMFRRPSATLERELRLQKRVVSLFAVKKKLDRLPTDYKYILKWTRAYSHYDGLIYKNGQQAFLDGNCTHKNCYITNDKSLLTDLTFFDAILFDVENNWDPHPLERSQYQRFIFTAAESADNFPVCSKLFDDYYNITWTYKLDSDIRNTYFNILDKNKSIVGPKREMNWVDPMGPTPKHVKDKLIRKSKTAAWFVSNCNAKSKRHIIANNIIKALHKHNFTVDIFGYCGQMLCPRNQLKECLKILQKEYYFYFSFENSLAEDYVTEKLLHAVMHYTVPVVYGGANYSRFLPPGSYINAGELDAASVATLMTTAIKEPKIYENYFKWHNYYSYMEAGEQAHICKLCEVINSPSIFTAKKGFQEWWNKDYKTACKRNFRGM